MCAPLIVGAVMAVAAVAKTTMQNKDAAKAEGQRADNARLQAQEYVKQNNYNQSNLSLQNRDSFENAIQQMTAKNMQGTQNLGTIDTSISESGMKGNSMNRLRRNVEASNDAEALNVTNEYKRNYSQIFGQQTTSQQQAISAISGLDQDAKKQSNGSQIMGTVMSGAQGFLSGYSMGGMFAGSAGTASMFGSTAAASNTGAAASNTGAMGMSTNFSSYTG